MAWTLLLAAGQGNRLASATGGLAKQFLDWKGAPLYWESTLVFSRCARVEGLVFVFPEACIDEERERVAGLMRNASLGIPWKVVAGGALRQDSVRNGLSALPDDCMEVLIHDAARPFVSPVLVNRILDGLHGEASGECVAACIPGIPVVDTIKVMDEEKKVVATPDRKHLMAVQTPQGFSLAFLRAAHQRAEQEGWVVTDDASLLELCGHAVHVAEGEAGNKKITTPEDLEMLRMTGERIPCVGYGYDVHKYADGNEARQPARPMRLGGCPLPVRRMCWPIPMEMSYCTRRWMPCLGVSGRGISEHSSLIPILHSTMSIRLCCWTRFWNTSRRPMYTLPMSI